MKWISTTFMIAFATVTFAGNEVRTTDKITAATIFLNGAQVFSTVQAQADAGINDIIIAGIPSNINEQSVQITGYGNFTVLSVSTRKNFLGNEQVRPETKGLKDSIEVVSTRLEEDQNRKFALEQEESLLLTNKSIGGANNGVIIADLEEAADFMRNRLADIRNKTMVVNKRIRQNQEKLSRLQNQLNQANLLVGLTQTEIVVTITAGAKGLIGMEVNYVVNDAGWEPFYDIKSKGNNSPIDLYYKAKVYQNTGVKWENIKLTLSSGDPNSNGIKPEIEPWRLNFAEPVQYQNRSMYKSAAPQMESIQIMDNFAVAGTLANNTSISRKEFAENFEINLPYSVETGGRPSYVDLQVYSIKANYKQATLPKIEESAYIVAHIYDWEKLSLIPAQANVFFEGAFVGETYLNTLSSTDTLAISLGRDKGLIVKREKIKDLSAEKMIGGNKRITYTYKITVRNTKTNTVDVEVEDQLPISEQTSIEVKALDLQGAQYDASTGKLKWNLNIASGSAKTIQFSFEVKHPKDKIVPGL